MIASVAPVISVVVKISWFGSQVGVCLQTKGWGIRVQARSHSGYGVWGMGCGVSGFFLSELGELCGKPTPVLG